MSALYTPSPRKPSYFNSKHPSASTPTRPHYSRISTGPDVVPSPSLVLLHSPNRASHGRVALQASSQSHQEGEGSSSDDPEEDGDEEEAVDDGLFFTSPVTPAASRGRSKLPLSELSNVHQRQPHPRVSTTNIDTPSKRIPAPQFDTPPTSPQTPDLSREWREFDGAESMTRLSLRERRDPQKENARQQQLQNHEGRRRPASPSYGSPTSPLHKAARFSPLRLANVSRPSLDYKNPKEPFPLLPTLCRPPSPSPRRSGPFSPANNSLLTDHLKAPSRASTHHSRLALKYQPRPRSSGGSGVENISDSDSGAAETSFGSSSSLADSNNGPVSPVTVNAEDDLGLVTPSIAPAESSGWPRSFPWGEGTTSRRFGEQPVDSDELLSQMARTAETRGAAAEGHSKPTVPDTPMKRNRMKQRAWQSTGKDWGLGLPLTSTGTVKAKPRKSMPGRIPNFAATCPDSPDSDSDPSPSKPASLSSTASRPPMAPRRSSVRGVDFAPADRDEDMRPIAALPLLMPEGSQSDTSSFAAPGRTAMLRRTSSSAVSSGSDQSGGMSVATTPTKRSHAEGSNAPILMIQPPTSSSSNHTLVPSSSFATLAVPCSPLSAKDNALYSPSVTPSLLRRPLLRRGSSTGSVSTRNNQQPDGVFSTPAPPSSFVLPKVVPPAPGPVRASMNSRPSLHGQTPARLPFRRESNPVHPSVSGIGSWGGSHSMASNSLNNLNHYGHQHPTPARIPSLFAASSSIGVRRPRSSTRLSVSVEEERGGAGAEPLVQELPGKFERDFVRSGEGSASMVGRGTFGQVFKVKAKRGGPVEKVYAVKRSKMYEGERHRARLLEEVEVLRHLTLSNGPCTSTPSTHRTTQGHDNVLHYIGAWEQDQALFIQTELCELGNLADFLLQFGKTYDRLDEPRLWKMSAEIANGLHHIHQSGALHLDLKPANVFVTKEGRLRIGDFGMATRWPRASSSSSSSGSIAGSGFEREGDREYLAAEILLGKYGPAADIFSFGMIMLEAAGNIVVPSNGEAWHRLRQDDFSDVNLESFSRPLVHFITRMLMASNHTKRPSIRQVQEFRPVARSRAVMKRNRLAVINDSGKMFRASAFATEPASFLEEVLAEDAAEDDSMDLS